MAVSGGNGGSDEVFSLVAGNSAQLLGFLKVASDETDKEDVITEAQEIIEMPPEEKFTGSANLFSSMIDVDDEISELTAEDLPPWMKQLFGQDNARELLAQMLKLLAGEVERIRERLYEEILGGTKHPESYLIVSLLFKEYEELLEYVASAVQDDEIVERNGEAVASIYSVLASHIIVISTKERKKIYPELVRDIFRYPFYFAPESSEDEQYDPEDYSIQEMEQGVLVESTTTLYQEESISVSRGAELLGVDRTSFEELLVERGIRPNYGPETAGELYDDIELNK